MRYGPEDVRKGIDRCGALRREDPRTGGLELFAHYPAGHVFAPRWHSANERIILLEGALSIQAGDAHKGLQPGGYAFLPAKQVQTMACGAASRCGFYAYWDGKLDNHKASEK